MKSRIVTPERRAFRAVATPGEALAMDPGGAGVIAAALRGTPPTPNAFGVTYDAPPKLTFDAASAIDGLAILRVEGPLEHHFSWWGSYEEIALSLDAALSCADVKGAALKIDSPGGVASGMVEIHGLILAMRKKYRKPIYAYGSGMVCSAAYNIASACTEIWAAEDAVIGSIGVILCTVDETKRLEKEGYAVRYVVTGARKADMHPGSEITDEVLRVAQSKVDYLGALFFRSVAKARGKTPKEIAALEAGVFYGPQAGARGLADGVASWSAFVKLATAAINATSAASSVRHG